MLPLRQSKSPVGIVRPGESRIAIMIPCYNEEVTIGQVIDDFHRELPGAAIVVFDNNSSDRSATIARERGATVVREPRQGKGFVVDRMLSTIDADCYVMVDGDATYDAAGVHEMVHLVTAGHADIAIGARLSKHQKRSFRPLHTFGNKLVTALLNRIFRANLTDVMSGYRAFNRKAARSLPITSHGFEVETEMTAQALYLGLHLVEVELPYGERPIGSTSKLHTIRDGSRVLWQIFKLLRAYRPLAFFGAFAAVFMVLALIAGAPPVLGFIDSGYREVKRFPLAMLATGLALLSFGHAFLGVLLHAFNIRFKEFHTIMNRR
jgi:glycosyltransferase involved in cell wall biosynthesis